MSRTESKSQTNREPLRLAFYGLATSELDIFTEVRRREGASLVLVVDPGPMAIAKRLAEIAGVQASSDAWDLTKADVDWIVTGKLVRTPGAPLRRAREAGVRVLDVAEAVKRLEGIEDREGIAASLVPPREPSAEGSAKAACGSTQEPTSGEKELPGVRREPVVPGREEQAFAVAREDWAPPLYEEVVAEETEVAEVAPPAEESSTAEKIPTPEDTTAAEETLAARGEGRPPERKPAYRPAPFESPLLRPTEGRFESARIVSWALEGMISSVRGSWGVALARSDGDVRFVERGINLRAERPDLWEWLRDFLESEVGVDIAPPQGSDKLVWVPLRVDSSLVAAVLLGTHSESEGFSQSDRLWLEKVGERIASILCSMASSTVIKTVDPGPVAPDSVWAAPLLDRAAWARGWLREHFEAAGCWLFAAFDDSPEPRLIDEDWGSVSPPFFSSTLREAMEFDEPQVWMDSGGERCHVIQPLAPWGMRWLVVLEGVPWRGEGKATLARLKKYAAVLARVLKST